MIDLTFEELANSDFIGIDGIEFVKVVKCKDCKNWDTTWQNDWAKNYHYCPLIDGTRNGDWYCADGERKSE